MPILTDITDFPVLQVAPTTTTEATPSETKKEGPPTAPEVAKPATADVAKTDSTIPAGETARVDKGPRAHSHTQSRSMTDDRGVACRRDRSWSDGDKAKPRQTTLARCTRSKPTLRMTRRKLRARSRAVAEQGRVFGPKRPRSRSRKELEMVEDRTCGRRESSSCAERGKSQVSRRASSDLGDSWQEIGPGDRRASAPFLEDTRSQDRYSGQESSGDNCGLSQQAKVSQIRALDISEATILNFISDNFYSRMRSPGGPRDDNEVRVRAAQMLLSYKLSGRERLPRIHVESIERPQGYAGPVPPVLNE